MPQPADDSPSSTEQLRAIEAELARPDHPSIVRQLLEEKRAALAAAIAATALTGSDTVDSARVRSDIHVGGQVSGMVVGVNLGSVIFNRDATEDERRRLAWYLGALAGKLYQLPLRGLTAKLEEGKALSMPQVYVMLAVRSETVVISSREAGYQAYFEKSAAAGEHEQRGGAERTLRDLRQEFSADFALPTTAITSIAADRADPKATGFLHQAMAALTARANPEAPAATVLFRQTLATEAVAVNRGLVLLGDPGSGKSTFLRHLAWALAQRGLDRVSEHTALFGWDDQRRLLPVIVPLRELAGRIARGAQVSRTPVLDVLRDEMTGKDVTQVDDLLTVSLNNGAALVMFDGLDEVPSEGRPGVYADRLTTLRAVRDFAATHDKARFVLTCRTRAFDEDLRKALGWPVETLAPFTVGQVRAFVSAMYGEIVRTGQMEEPQAGRYGREIIDTIADPGNDRLRGMAGTPLLLTMMAMVLYNRGTLPRDRPQLYEAVLELLLGQWDKVRDGQSLAEVIGDERWGSDRIRPLLNRLSYEAHQCATSDDGRGRIERDKLQGELIRFFTDAKLPDPWAIAGRCLDYFVHRSGLIMPDEQHDYVFAHLTLQEHCAGCHMVTGSEALARVMGLRADDRWREPIMLGLGYIQGQRPELIEQVLNRLLGRDESGLPKPIDRWYRDLIFAAEIGADRDWGYLGVQPIDVAGIQARLREGLVALLADRDQPIPVTERLRAGALLGGVGDPRIPVLVPGDAPGVWRTDQWIAELEKCNTTFGHPDGYWCFVKPGTYRIGGWGGGKQSAEVTLPAFWIARFPVTVAQFEPFVEEGYGEGAERWWTPNGWRWKVARDRTKPWRWGDKEFSCANQPVIGVTWYEAAAWCNWLTEKLGDHIPADHAIRLPTEAEWEAAAADDANGRRREYPWSREEPITERAIFDETGLGHPAPTGVCPTGAAACGALDMAGNVWEVTTSHHGAYPSGSNTEMSDFKRDEVEVPWRGGSWYMNRTSVRCGARGRTRPDDVNGDLGLRVVLASKLAAS